MRRLALLATIAVTSVVPFALPSTGTATPGGLDSVGGHHCWTNCASYGVKRGDYHCHRNTKACKRSDRRHRRHGH